MSAPSGYLCVLTSLHLPAAVPRCGLGGTAGPSPLAISSLLLLSLLASMSWVAGEFPSPPCHHPSALDTPSPSEVTLKVPPPGQLFHFGGFDAPWQLEPPSYSLAIPRRVFRHSGGLGAPLSATHPRGLAVRIFPPAGNPLPYPLFRPMAAS